MKTRRIEITIPFPEFCDQLKAELGETVYALTRPRYVGGKVRLVIPAVQCLVESHSITFNKKIIMRKYDYDKARKLIDEAKETLESASLGMHEDWFWTAETVWADGKYERELLTNAEADETDARFIARRKEGMSIISDEGMEYKHMISGIYGSRWATPTLQLTYKDGTVVMINVSILVGEDIPLGEKIEKQIQWTSGCLAGPCQENIPPLSTDL